MSISIITTVLNNEKFIHYCLRSVQSQKIRNNIEHIIVDGGSTDKTFSIIKKFQKKNKYVKVFQIKNIGIYQGINYGIKKAKYKYVGLLHSDDFYKNKKVLKEVLKILNKKKNFTSNLLKCRNC